MRQRLAFVAVKENDVAGLGLSLSQLEAQSHTLDFGGNLTTLQRVAGPPPAEVFFRNALDNCDRPILTSLDKSNVHTPSGQKLGFRGLLFFVHGITVDIE